MTDLDGLFRRVVQVIGGDNIQAAGRNQGLGLCLASACTQTQDLAMTASNSVRGTASEWSTTSVHVAGLTLEADHHRDSKLELGRCLDDALSNDVTAHDATKDVDQDG